MLITSGPCVLGNHYHPSRELLFTPTGGFKVDLVNSGDPSNPINPNNPPESKSFVMGPGSRLLIPEYLAHRATAPNGGLVLFSYSSSTAPVVYNPCSPKILSVLDSLR